LNLGSTGNKPQVHAAEFVSQTGRTLLNLREMLLRGEFQPGERISELPLVAKLGVSRTPIRLSLDRLAHEGLLEVSPSGGFVVKEFTVDDIWDAIEMRGALEGTAARLAAERLKDSAELADLHRYRDEMDACAGSEPNIDSYARYLDLNDAFHAEVVKLAKSPVLRRTLDHVLSLPFAQPSAVVFAKARLPKPDDMFAVGQEQHRVIVEAIGRRQGMRAEATAREHTTISRRILEVALEDRSVFSYMPGASLIRLPATV
jgi:GntR family transcriptional regulator of vanillate catabolism